ncbi:hypothetical protein [Pseudoneobacillus rhizosphaerae]|uniref:ACT domain-containing protein n=1 Tax=Pseudoneobacillus rhizosphaerae TaxID=2880968 RepID=A0A9C7GE00_9BACI|nr:hypothetical protein [Pseudoneobacillus rhizosphaerae]CAG9610387.1 hypothetical protein NEOCIP111885_04161 [Pseudoneobacillus rhizosphaerae]
MLSRYGARIVTINHYRIDIKPEKNLLIIKHHDIPGMIGRVGSLLGITWESRDKHWNDAGSIANIGGEAIMVLTLDKEIPELVINQLSSIKGLNTAQLLELNTMDGCDEMSPTK